MESLKPLGDLESFPKKKLFGSTVSEILTDKNEKKLNILYLFTLKTILDIILVYNSNFFSMFFPSLRKKLAKYVGGVKKCIK